jgi:hypothetical protein
MTSMSPMSTPDGPLNWNPASVMPPEMPMLAPGEDAMSMTIAGVLPTLTAPLTASVAALSAKETTFSGKVTSADSAYQNADDAGGQSVGQLGQMLGQVGQMAQQAGQQAGGQSGMFGSMMQEAMKAAQGGGGSQGGGSQGGSTAAGAQPSSGQPSAGQGPGGAGAAPQQSRDDAAGGHDQASDGDRDEQEKGGRHERAPLDAAAPDAAPNGAGPAPVAPPEHPRHGGGEDLSRRM